MALLFAPQVEIRRDKELTRLSNVLCGLGFDPVKKSSYFAEHDAVFNVDVNFDLKDLEMVNQIRYSMSQLVYLEPSETKPRNTDVQGNLKMNIKKLIIKSVLSSNSQFILNLKIIFRLLEKPRLNLGVNNECDPEIWGRNIDRSDLILSKDALTTRYVWPAIPVPYTYRRKTKDLEKLKEHVRDLKNCEGELNGHFVRCELCAKDFETVPELRRHLLSKLHKDLEFQLI